jgi:hypothetical protein
MYRQRKGANAGTMSRRKDIAGSTGNLRSAGGSHEGSPVKDSQLGVQVQSKRARYLPAVL